ncbi:UDP-4-amino-4,6-dideoxy-N-acetyl-beta-L-altrosamine transaminase [bacterium]|nr:UDP-4-amino-4,6-dideoxy-N-acetyl-beta-L-altrosamine transaminase [bacterium]
MIPYGKQDINQSDIDSVVGVLQSDFLTQGPQVPLFEEAVSNYCGSQHGVAVNSATSALHIACLALSLGKGDYFWTSPNSFVASANCGLYCGAKVDFVDIDEKTYNMSVVELEKKLIQAKKDNKLPKIVIPVHFAGQSCDMKKIYSLGKEYGFSIIEDASHAIGGKYLDKPVGGCQYSDITVFSFHPVKIITTAEGGLATTNSRELSEKMQMLRSHGITRNPSLMNKESEGEWYYQQIDLGFNYRMTELQAALGISQIQRLDDFVIRRNALGERYDKLLDGMALVKPSQFEDSSSAMHLYPIKVDNRGEIFKKLREGGVGVSVHYIPIHMQPYYKSLGFKSADFPVSEDYYNRAVSIPLFAKMTENQQDKVIKCLRGSLQ